MYAKRLSRRSAAQLISASCGPEEGARSKEVVDRSRKTGIREASEGLVEWLRPQGKPDALHAERRGGAHPYAERTAPPASRAILIAGVF